ncbi:MAG: hypothetical protein IJ036_02480 [Lachnospiraceae bacterium]|nr:hypothetical protein [Lachnospiraceae bacterium]
MELLIEIIFSVIFEGSLELITKKSVPMFIRVLLAFFLTAFSVAISALLFYLGIKNRSIIILIFAVLLSLLFIAAIIALYKKLKEKKNE